MKLSVFSKFLAKNSDFAVISQVTFYDNVITCDVTLLVSKDVFTNKEQLYQTFDNRSKSKKLKAKKIEGGQFDPPLQGFWG